MNQANRDSFADAGDPLSPTKRFRFERKWQILGTVGVGSFMAGLDSSIVNTVLPVIRQEFGTDLSTIEWVMMIYLLTISIILLSFGRLGDILGHKRVYNFGFVLFTIGSLLCGMSSSETQLIIFRGFQALGAGMIMSNALPINTGAFPPNERGRAVGIQATMVYLGLTLGPSLGGFLADHLGWRAIFYVNLPIGILATFLAFLIIPNSASKNVREPFDIPGAVTFLIGLASLMLAMSKGQVLGWTSPLILGLFATALVFLAIFLWLERTTQHPMLDLSLFSNHLFSFAIISGFINYLCVTAVSFLIPFYLVQARGFSPSHTGMLLTVQPLIMAVMAAISGHVSDRTGPRFPATTGMVCLAVGIFALRGMGNQASEIDIVLRLGLIGLGTGMFTSPNVSSIMGCAPRNRQGVAAASSSTSRNLGQVLGVAVAGAIFSTRLIQRTAPDISSQMAFFEAMGDTFLVIALLACVGIFTSLARGSATPAPIELAERPGTS